MIEIPVDLGERGYSIVIAEDATRLLPERLAPFAGRRIALVSDRKVHKLHGARVERALKSTGRVSRILVPPGERYKTRATVDRIQDELLRCGFGRDGVVVALGGGVVGDMAGFAAATYMRGLDWIGVPTTLLSMVDSSIGGKVGVNHPRAKNLIGAFHQPAGVWIDTATLATLPDREYRSGLAEVVKYGVILDAELFALLEDQADAVLRRDPGVVRAVVARCCRLKADVVEQDEREETGLRAVLNYGHTFGHAFEAAAGYGRWLHGEAVA